MQIVSKLKTPAQHTQAGAGAAQKKKKITPTVVSAGAGKKKKKITPSLVSAGAGKKKKKKITPTLVSASVGGGSSMPFGMPAGGGTAAQKKFQKKLTKQKEAYKKLKGKDANPELAF